MLIKIINMKKILLVIFLFLSTILFSQSKVIEFDTTAINYGIINKGDEGKRNFQFTNVSKEPIVILTVTVYCGCTVPNWTNEPILPNEKGTITVEYDTQRVGRFGKEVKVKTSGSDIETRLIIWGEILP